MDFGTRLCNPYDFGPLTGTFLSLCFTDLLLFTVEFVLLLVFGFPRIFQLRKYEYQHRKNSIPHLVELVCSILIVLCPVTNFLFLFLSQPTPVPVFKWLMTVGWSCMWLIVLIIMELEYKRGVRHNWVVVTFWVIAATLNGIRLESLKIEERLDDASIWFVVIETGLSVVLSLNALVNNEVPPSLDEDDEVSLHDENHRLLLEKPEDYGTDIKAKPKMTDESQANIFSQLTFWWYTPLLKKGYYTALVHDDLPPVRADDKVSIHADRFERSWEHEEQTGRKSLVWAIARAYGRRFFFAGLFKIGNDIFIFTGPVILEQIVIFMSSSDDIWFGVLLAVILFVGTEIQSMSMQQYWQRVYRCSMIVYTALTTKTYSKSLRISHRERQKSTVGEIINLQSVDSKQLASVVIFLHQLWSAPLQIIVSIVLLWRVLGPASLGGLAILILTSPSQIFIGRVMAGIQKEIMKKKDARIKTTNEVLQGIRVLKFFAWETSFSDKIKSLRWNELYDLRKAAFIRAGIMLIWNMTPLLVTIVSFGIYVALGNTLTAEKAFSALALFDVMRFPLNILPMLITQLIEAQVSLERLQKFFSGDELDPNAVSEELDQEEPIVIKNGTFEWDVNKPVLKNLNISIPAGSLVGVIGEVGSGKSTLLNAILGEVPKVSGEVCVRGRIAYVPQTAWIKNASVKDNITFMNDVDDIKYSQVLKVCQLQPDLAILTAGDQTEIGEKGINLSGGQKQRVSMARAVYSDADIYLLDDPLSAVDAHVGKALFHDCLSGVLAKKTRILVTHQLQYLNECDLIIVLKKGVVTEMGSYQDLSRTGGEFSSLVQKHVVEKEAEQKQKEKKEQEEKKEKQEKETKPEKPAGGAPKPSGQLMVGETRETGGVDWRVYVAYMQAVGGFLLSAFLILLYTSETASSMTANYWLSYWSTVSSLNTTSPTNTTSTTILLTNSMRRNIALNGETFADSPYCRPTISEYSHGVMDLPSLSTNETHLTKRYVAQLGFGSEKVDSPLERELGVYFYLMVYSLIGVCTSLLIISRSFLLAQAGINASKNIHNRMLDRVLSSPVSFFDTVPVGRILNRFSSDQNVIDTMLPRTLGSALDTILTSLSVIFVIASATPVFLVSLLSLGFLYRYVQKYYLRSSRELQRLDAMARSPIYALFGETLNGLSTIRAYDKVKDFIDHNQAKIERNNQATYMASTANRWLGVRLEFFGAMVVFAAGFFAVVSRDQIAPGIAGLSISYALRLTGNLNWLVRMSTDVENNLVSVERCIQYTKLDTEAELRGDPAPRSEWPEKGAISIKNLRMRYRPNLPEVLKGISLEIRPKERIGVVGRTGAGKSSLMLALFRIVEPADGQIEIDGQNILRMGLHDLRERLSIIPQDATLFTGTIRSNLNPFDKYSDEELWSVIDAVGMRSEIEKKDKGLDAAVSEYGENLSVGTRQLLCLARAILRRSRILVMDEATANVDFETDELIQKTIRREFSDVTVLTIAHRINTIMDYDRVIVLDQGQVIEFDSPQKLCQDPNSAFYSLAQQAGVLDKKKKRDDDLLM